MSSVTIVYFTGTGNTERAARTFAQEAALAGHAVRLARVMRGSDAGIHETDFLVVLFPVYSFAPPGPFMRFLGRIPRTTGAKAAIIENHGMASLKGGLHTGYGAAATDMIAALLERKGFHVIYTGGVGYPENITFLANALPERRICEIIQAADREVRLMARDVLGGRVSLTRHGLFARMLSVAASFVFNRLGAWQFGKLYVATTGCNSCGLCERACPAGAVRIVGGRPRWSLRCTVCLCCYNACPKNAVQLSLLRVGMLSAATVVPILLVCQHVDLFWQASRAVLSAFPPMPAAALTVILAALACGAGFLGLFLFGDILAHLAETAPVLGKLARLGLTGRLRRYTAPGFDPFRGPQRDDARTLADS